MGYLIALYIYSLIGKIVLHYVLILGSSKERENFFAKLPIKFCQKVELHMKDKE